MEAARDGWRGGGREGGRGKEGRKAKWGIKKKGREEYASGAKMVSFFSFRKCFSEVAFRIERKPLFSCVCERERAMLSGPRRAKKGRALYFDPGREGERKGKRTFLLFCLLLFFPFLRKFKKSFRCQFRVAFTSLPLLLLLSEILFFFPFSSSFFRTLSLRPPAPGKHIGLEATLSISPQKDHKFLLHRFSRPPLLMYRTCTE